MRQSITYEYFIHLYLVKIQSVEYFINCRFSRLIYIPFISIGLYLRVHRNLLKSGVGRAGCLGTAGRIADSADETVAGIAPVVVDAVRFQRVGAGLDVEKVRPLRADPLPLAALDEDLPRGLDLLDEQLLLEIEGAARGNPRLIGGHGESPRLDGRRGLRFHRRATAADDCKDAGNDDRKEAGPCPGNHG